MKYSLFCFLFLYGFLLSSFDLGPFTQKLLHPDREVNERLFLICLTHFNERVRRRIDCLKLRKAFCLRKSARADYQRQDSCAFGFGGA